jgi:hypothetical protein
VARAARGAFQSKLAVHPGVGLYHPSRIVLGACFASSNNRFEDSSVPPLTPGSLKE